MIDVHRSLSSFGIRSAISILYLLALCNRTVLADYPPSASEKIEVLVNDQLNRPGAQSISVGTLLDGVSLYFQSGIVDAVSDQKPDEHTVYEIGSISKTITGTLLAEAALAKQLDLEDDVRKYLEGDYSNLVFENEPIRIKHLLNHTSGLPRELPLKEEDFRNMTPDLADKLHDIQARFSDRDLLQALHTVTLTRRPGVTFSYSNTAARVCSIALERACNKPYRSMLKDFFASNGMHHSWPCASEDFLASKQITAGGHDQQGHPHLAMACTMAAGGAVLSTAEDMLIYARLHLDESNPTTQLSHKSTWGDIRYYASGLNWQMERPANKPYRIWQSGSTGGSTALLQIYPEDKFAVVLLTNEGDENSEGNLGELAMKIHEICVRKR